MESGITVVPVAELGNFTFEVPTDNRSRHKVKPLEEETTEYCEEKVA